MEKNNYHLSGELRKLFGKNNAKKLKKNGNIPSVIYAKNKKTLNVFFSLKKITKLLKNPYKRNSIINFSLKNKKNIIIMIKELQIHPTRRNIIHIDFIQINQDQKIKTKVPIFLYGKNINIIQDGKLNQLKKNIQIASAPKSIPANISLDISNIPSGKFFAKNIKMPSNVLLSESPNLIIFTIKQANKSQENK